MFDREEFIAYVGGNSGTSYASGLKNIEKLYSVNIDAEFEKDRCVEVLSKIESDKKRSDLPENELHNRQNYYSHLKRYVEFRTKLPAIGQKQRFITWMAQQPQREDPTKTYSDVTIKAAAAKLQSGFETLGIEPYTQTNAFSITDAETFLSVYSACYDTAEAQDKRQGTRDFRNGLDFYMHFLSGENKMNTHAADPMREKIKEVLASYKASFATVDKEERYKWEAIGWYKQHWDIDAEDFASMVKTAFGEMKNLLTAGMYYAYKMLTDYAQADPEAVRGLFKTLYDETISLSERYVIFRDSFAARYKPLGLNHYQDLHAISVYLASEYPEKYFIFKSTMYTTFRDRIGFSEDKPMQKSVVWKVESYYKLCEIVLSEIKNDNDLISMSKSRLDETCYQDEALHLLTMDVIYYGSNYMSEDEFHVQSKVNARSSIQPESKSVKDENATNIGLNTILYGPPGTGKTYHTVIYAVAIIENRELASVEAEDYAEVLDRYNEYKAQGRIEFTTFHQAYGYEEFIEGIKPTVSDEDESGDIKYSVQPGVFKRFCERAERPVAIKTKDYEIGETAAIWKVSLWGTGDNEVRTECLQNGHIRIGWDQYGKEITDETDFSEDGGRVVLNAFINRMQVGDIVFSCYSASTIDAIGVVTGEYEWHNEYENLRRLRKVKWLVKDIRENILEMNGGTSMTLASVYRLSNIALSDVYRVIEKYQPAQTAQMVPQQENYAFIIDEINRGNISKIFGELITLIESSKRVGKPEETKAILPYSQKPFGVPKNVYIIGTMNTADRSIAAIDTALRRRFFFREMLPNAKVLEDISVEDLSISELLTRMNQRIAVLYDREHTIGHAYFMPLKHSPTIETLSEIFSNNIIPLLQEYFYEDYEKIRLVLGDNRKTDESEQFIIARDNNYAELFGNADVELDDGSNFEINKNAFAKIESYRSI